MNVIFLWLVVLLHGGQMIMSTLDKQWPIALMMLGFTVADLGILWAAR